jgi:hypothetical protein
MSYSELRQHAQRIEELAFRVALVQAGVQQNPDGSYTNQQNGSVIPNEYIELNRRNYDGVASMFDPFLNMPNPEALRVMHGHFAEALRVLSTGIETTDPVHGVSYPGNPEMAVADLVINTLDDWDGPAARQFISKFLNPWPIVIANHFCLVATLAGAIAAEQNLWTQCEINVDKIAHAAIAALEAMEKGGSADPDALVILLSVASSVFAVGATMATGPVAAITLTAVGSVAQVGGTVIDKKMDPAPELQFDAKRPNELIEQVQNALYRVMNLVLSKEEEIAQAMSDSALTVDAGRSDFVFPRPWLVDQTASTVLTSQGLGAHS